jgi:hydroxypyruvate reductase
MPLARKMSGAAGHRRHGPHRQAIATARAAFGMAIAYTARSAKARAALPLPTSAEALAAESDFLVVITPGGAATRKLIDRGAGRAGRRASWSTWRAARWSTRPR